MSMKIRTNEAAVLPPADGYLAQIDFKNFFLDFRWKDCVFVKTPDDIVNAALASDDTLSEGVWYSPSKGETIDGVIAKLKKAGYDGVRVERNVYVPVAYRIKVWPMVAGERVQKAIPAFVLIREKTIGNEKDVEKAKAAAPDI